MKIAWIEAAEWRCHHQAIPVVTVCLCNSTLPQCITTTLLFPVYRSRPNTRFFGCLVIHSVFETRPKCSDQDQDQDRNSAAKIRRLHRPIVTNRLPNNRISKVTSRLNRDYRSQKVSSGVEILIFARNMSPGDASSTRITHVWTMQTRSCTASLPVIFLSYSVARTRPPALFYNNHPLPLFMISWTDFTGYLSGPESTSKSPHSPRPTTLTFGHPAYLRELISPYQPSTLSLIAIR